MWGKRNAYHRHTFATGGDEGEAKCGMRKFARMKPKVGRLACA
jgi:hypothetical protein